MAKFNMDFSINTDIKSVKQAEAEVKRLGRELRNIKNDTSISVEVKDEQIKKTQMKLNALEKAMKTTDSPKNIGKNYQKGLAEMVKQANLAEKALKDVHRETNNMSKVTDRAGNDAKKLAGNLKSVSAAAKVASLDIKETNGLISKMGKEMSMAVSQTLAFGGVAAAMGAVGDSFRQVADIDKVLTDIAVVIEDTRGSVQGLAEDAAAAADSLGTTGKRFLEASLIFKQQGGLAQEYSDDLAKATVVLSNVTRQTTEDVSQMITAAINGFRLLDEMGSEAGMHVADVFAKLGAVSGSASEEIADALTRVGSVADQAGFTLTEMSAAIATVSEVTRRTPQTVGTAFKSLITSIQEVRDAGDEELGKFTNKIQGVIDKFNILDSTGKKVQIFDDTGELRDARDLLFELGDAYQNLGSKTAQAALTQAIAGKYQADQLQALFSNWDRFNTVLVEGQNSQGAALEQQSVYMDSIEAKVNQMKNAWEELSMAIISEDSIKGFYEGLTKALQTMTEMVESGQMLSTILMPIAGILGAGLAKGAGQAISTKVVQRSTSKSSQSEMKDLEGSEKLTEEQAERLRLLKEEEKQQKIINALGENGLESYRAAVKLKDEERKATEKLILLEKQLEDRKKNEATRSNFEKVAHNNDLKYKGEINAFEDKFNDLIKERASISETVNKIRAKGEDISERESQLLKEHAALMQKKEEAIDRLIVKSESNLTTQIKQQQAEANTAKAAGKGADTQIQAIEKRAKVMNVLGKAMSGMAVGLPTFIGLMNGLNKAEEEGVSKTDAFGDSLIGLAGSLVFMGQPIPALVAGVGGLALKLFKKKDAVKEAKKANEEYVKSMEALKAETNKIAGVINPLKQSFGDLAESQKQLDAAQKDGSLSAEEYTTKMDELAIKTKEANEYASERIAEIAPEMVKYYTEEGKAVVDVKTAMAELNLQYAENRKLQSEMLQGNMSNFITQYRSELMKLPGDQDKAKKKIEELQKSLSVAYSEGNSKDIKKYTKDLQKQRETLGELNNAYGETKGAINQNIVQPMLESSDALNKLPDAFKNATTEIVNLNNVMSIFKNSLNPEDEIKNLNDSIQLLGTVYNNFRIEMLQGNDEAKQSWEDLSQAPAEAISYLNTVMLGFSTDVETASGNLKELVQDLTYVKDSAGKVITAFSTDLPNMEDLAPSTEEYEKKLDTLNGKINKVYGDLNKKQDEMIQKQKELDTLSQPGISSLFVDEDTGELVTAGDIGWKKQEQQKVLKVEQNELEQEHNRLLEQRDALMSEQNNKSNIAIQLQREANQAFYEQLRAAAQTPEGFNAIVSQMEVMQELVGGEKSPFYAMVQQLDELDEATNKMRDNIETVNEVNLTDVTESFSDIEDSLIEVAKNGGEKLREALDVDADTWKTFQEGFGEGFSDAFEEVTDKMQNFQEEYTQMMLALNADNAEFFAAMKADSQNADYFNEAAMQLGVFADQYATHGEFINEVNRKTAEMQAIYSDQAATAVYNSVMEEQAERILGAEKFEQLKRDEISIADLAGKDQAEIAAATAHAAEMANAQVSLNMAEAQLRALRTSTDTAKGIKTNLDGIEISTDAIDQAIQEAETRFLNAQAQLQALEAMGEKGFAGGSTYKSPVSSGASIPKGNYKIPDRKKIGGGKTNTGGTGDGKGGGKDKGKEDVKDLQLEIDIYRDYDEQLRRVEKSLESIRKKKDEAYGRDKLKYMQQESNELAKQQKLLESQMRVINEQAKGQRGNKKSGLAAFGFTFDKEGYIKNYNEVMEKLTKQANAKTGDAKKQAQDQVKAVQDMVKDYEATMKLKLDTEKAMDDVKKLQHDLYKEQFEFRVNAIFEIDEKSQKLFDLIKDMNDSLDGTPAKVAAIQGSFKSSAEAVKENIKLLEDLNNPKKFKELTDAERGQYAEEAIERLFESMQNLKEQYEELKDLQGELWDAAVEGVNKALEGFDTIIGRAGDLADVYQSVYGSMKMGDIDKLYGQQVEAIEAQISGYKELIKAAQDYYEKNKAVMSKEQIDAYNDFMEEQSGNVIAASARLIETLQNQFDAWMENARDQLERDLFGTFGLDGVQQKFDYLQKQQDKYLNGFEKITEVGAMISKVNEQIAKTTDPQQLAQLEAFREKELAGLRDKENLSVKDLERAELKYQLLLKEQAMQERQQLSMIAQLQRDEAGNFVYQYVPDPNQVKKEVSEVKDALGDLIEFEENNLKEANQGILDANQEFMSEVAALKDKVAQGLISEEEFNAALDGIQNKYKDTLGKLQQEQADAMKSLTEAGLAKMLLQFMDEGSVSGFGDTTNSVVQSLLENVQNGTITMQDLIAGNYEQLASDTGLSMDEIKNAMGEMTEAVQADNKAMSDALGFDTGEMATKVSEYIDAIKKKYDEYKDNIEGALGEHTSLVEGLTGSLKDQKTAVSDATDAFKAMGDYLTNTLNPATNDAKKAYEKLAEQLGIVGNAIGSEKNKDTLIGKMLDLIDKEKDAVKGAEKIAPALDKAQKDAKIAADKMNKTIGTIETSAKSAAAKVQSIANEIAGLKDKTVTVTTVHETKYKTTGTPPNNPSGDKTSKTVNFVVKNDNGTTSIYSHTGTQRTFKGTDTVSPTYKRAKDLSYGDPIGFFKGGYTGKKKDGGLDGFGGKHTIVHPEELILNKEDTKNMLEMLKVSRDVLKSDNNLFKELSGSSDLNQNVTIQASFPNARNSQEIEKAFNNLSAKAMQYAFAQKS